MTVGSQRNERGQNMSRKRRPDPWEVTGKVFALLTQLNERKVATPTGGDWHAATVIRVQKRLG